MSNINLKRLRLLVKLAGKQAYSVRNLSETFLTANKEMAGELSSNSLEGLLASTAESLASVNTLISTCAKEQLIADMFLSQTNRYTEVEEEESPSISYSTDIASLDSDYESDGECDDEEEFEN